MAKILSIFYLTIHKLIEGTVMGWQFPVLYKLPMILNLFLIPEQVVFKMDLEIRELNFLKSQYPADTTKSLYYVIEFYLN